MNSCQSCRHFTFPLTCKARGCNTLCTRPACSDYVPRDTTDASPGEKSIREATEAIADFDTAHGLATPAGPSEAALAAALRAGDASLVYRQDDTPGTKLRVIPIKTAYSVLAEAVTDAIPAGALYQIGRYKNYAIAWEILSGSKRGELYTDLITPETFSSWIDKFVYFVSSPDKDFDAQKRTSLSPAQSKLIMESPIMRQRIPIIEQHLAVRLPIRKLGKNGKPHFEPAPAGYDINTGIFTTDTHDIDWSSKPMSRELIRKTILRELSESGLDGMNPPTMDSRSVAAVVTAQLSFFLSHCMKTAQGILLVANQPGSGKSFLARYIFSPVEGDREAMNYPDNEEERRKTFMAALDAGERIAFLDDVHSLNSTTLNRFMTNATVTDRKIGTGDTLSLVNRMHFVITGNNLKTSKDLERRLLPIDIFRDGPATEKEYAEVLTEEMFSDPAWRRDHRQILWDMVRHWEADGCPQYVRTVPGFKDFSMCANIAVHCGFVDPYGPRQVALDTGDARSAATEEVLSAAAALIDLTTNGTEGLNLIEPIYAREAPQFREALQERRGGILVKRLPKLEDEHLTLIRDAFTSRPGKTTPPHTVADILADYENGGDTGLYVDLENADIAAIAEAEAKLGIILDSKKVTSAQGQAIALGQYILKFKGRTLRDPFGRLVLIGSRRTSASTRYRFTILSPRDPSIAPPIAPDGSAPEDDEDNPF